VLAVAVVVRFPLEEHLELVVLVVAATV